MENEKAEKLKEIFGAMPNIKEMQAIGDTMQKLAEIIALLSEVLPPIEIKAVTRTFKQGDKTFSKDYIAIYISRPAKKEEAKKETKTQTAADFHGVF